MATRRRTGELARLGSEDTEADKHKGKEGTTRLLGSSWLLMDRKPGTWTRRVPMRVLVTRRPADGPDKDEDGRAKDKDRGSNAVAGKQATCR